MKPLLAFFAVTLVITAALSAEAQERPKPTEKSSSAAATSIPRRIPDTLMFSIDEVNDIQLRSASSTRGGAEDAQKADAVENATLYLSTIVYYGPTDWTIWVNGLPIGPKQDFQAFKITNINPNYVELLVPLSAEGMRPVRLSPNQTFIAKSGAVIEGPWK
jgi:hypothetical protein